jgi:hypothetical protein
MSLTGKRARRRVAATPGVARQSKRSSTNPPGPSLTGAWPCTCGGYNANCYRCSGLGTTASQVLRPQRTLLMPRVAALPPVPKKPQALLARPPAENSFARTEALARLAAAPCPICRCTLGSDGLAAHMLHAHPAALLGPPKKKLSAAPAAPAVPAAPRTFSILVRCPHCPSAVSLKNIKRHFRLVHKLDESAVPLNFKSVGRDSVKTYPRVNPLLAPVRPKAAAIVTRPAVVWPGTIVVNTLAKPLPREFRRRADGGRDGSKHIGQFARDHGSFGSMPMHDGYGDEDDA